MSDEDEAPSKGIKYAKGDLAKIIDWALAFNGARATPSGGTPQQLRLALYKHMARRGIQGFRVTVEGEEIVLTPVEVVTVELNKEPKDDANS